MKIVSTEKNAANLRTFTDLLNGGDHESMTISFEDILLKYGPSIHVAPTANIDFLNRLTQVNVNPLLESMLRQLEQPVVLTAEAQATSNAFANILASCDQVQPIHKLDFASALVQLSKQHVSHDESAAADSNDFAAMLLTAVQPEAETTSDIALIGHIVANCDFS